MKRDLHYISDTGRRGLIVIAIVGLAALAAWLLDKRANINVLKGSANRKSSFSLRTVSAVLPPRLCVRMNLTQAVRGQPHPPCEGCYLRVRCATERLACLEFTSYVHLHGGIGRGDRHPNRARYKSTFPGNEEVQ